LLMPLGGISALPEHKEAGHARSHLRRDRRAFDRAHVALRRRLPPSLKERAMVEPIIGLLVGVLLGAYLLYTLIYPEKF